MAWSHFNLPREYLSSFSAAMSADSIAILIPLPTKGGMSLEESPTLNSLSFLNDPNLKPEIAQNEPSTYSLCTRLWDKLVKPTELRYSNSRFLPLPRTFGFLKKRPVRFIFSSSTGLNQT